MRVNYLLPALEPGILPDSPDSAETGISFRDQLQHVSGQASMGWEQQLHLDARPFTATYIAPPSRPKRLELEGVEVERARWRNLLSRHEVLLPASPSVLSSTSGQSVQVMLEMLRDMQEAEDGIVAQAVSLTRG
jgi:hypothetical protein